MNLNYSNDQHGRYVAALEGETHFMIGTAATREEAVAMARKIHPQGRCRTGQLRKIEINLDGLSGMILGELKRRADSHMPEGHPFDCGWPDGATKAHRADLDDEIAGFVQTWCHHFGVIPRTLTVVDVVYHDPEAKP